MPRRVVQYFTGAKKHCRSLCKAAIFKCSFWPIHVVYTQCHDRCEVNGIHPKQSWERKRENDKLENTDTAEKLLKNSQRIESKETKSVIRSSKKRKKTAVLSNTE